MFKVELPYDIGTFVKITNPLFERKDVPKTLFGTVSGYTVLGDGYTIWVSGYKESWGGEYLPSEISPMTAEKIEKLKGENDD